MNHTGSFEERIQNTLRATMSDKEKGGAKTPFYEIVHAPGPTFVVEDKKDGLSRVACYIPEGALSVKLNIRDGLFQFLREAKNADGAFLVRRADGLFEAHVIECKRSVNQSKWEDAIKQVRWTVLCLLSLAGALGIQVEAIVLQTAYRFDKLSPDDLPNPNIAKAAIGPLDADEEEPTTARRKQLEWERDEVTLDGFDGWFPHVKVKLDERTGEGKTMLALARSSTVAQ